MTDSMPQIPLFINAEERRSLQTFEVISPVIDQTIHLCSAASLADVDAATEAAAAAFQTWRKTTPAERRDIFLKAIDIIRSRQDEISNCLMAETGANRSWADFNIRSTTEMLKDVAGRIPTLEGSIPALMDPQRSAMVIREPYGVVLAVAPWNAPILLSARSVSYPLAAGNTVVLKASEAAPRSIWAVVSAFHDAGLPKGVLNMIVHDRGAAAATTAALIANPHVKKINFTGSSTVGRIVAKLAGEHLKPLVLELGGKASAIVWDDADLELAAEQCAVGAFLYSGQICMSTERILVHRSIKQQFVAHLKTATERFAPTESEAMILINGLAVERNRHLVADAVSKGATVIHGDVDQQEASKSRMRPIIVDQVTPDMTIYKAESFGPTVSVIEVESEEEAVRIANDTEYGLSAAIFTEDLRRGLRLAREIETGAVHINSTTVADEPVLPHGGAKASGYGRFNASAGLGEWLRSKNITF
ncbi:hypothetical protein HIM_03105 [Hirsutella minnesotensis 3608]|nr:hypothetical protein HIM_03105 [Hirsutella minnesotensis 3608]